MRNLLLVVVITFCSTLSAFSQIDWNRIKKLSIEQRLSAVDSLLSTHLSEKDSLKANLYLAIAYFENTEYKTAITLLNEGVKRCIEAQYDSLSTGYFQSLGVIHTNLNQRTRAIEYFKQSVSFAKLSGTKIGLMNNYGNLSSAYLEELMPDSAFRYLNLSLALHDEIYDEVTPKKLFLMRILATGYDDVGEYKKSVKIFRELIALTKQMGDEEFLNQVYVFYSQCLNHSGKADSAVYYSGKVVGLEYTPDRRDLLFFAKTTHGRNLYAAGRYKEAYEFLDAGRTLELEDRRDNMEKSVAELEAKLGTERIKSEKLIAEQEAGLLALERDKKAAENQRLIIALLATILLFAIAVLAFFLIQSKRKRESEVKMRRERINALLEGEEKEKNRISQELHDGVSQLLFALKLNLSRLDVNDQTVSELLQKVTTEIRDISHNLSSHSVSKMGLVKALESMLNSSIKDQLEYKINGGEDELALNDATSRNLYRICQELVTNTIKHADASAVNLNLKKEGNALVFNYKDNGKGLSNTDFSNGIGFSNMMSRVEALNASINITGERGIEVNISVPMAA